MDLLACRWSAVIVSTTFIGGTPLQASILVTDSKSAFEFVTNAKGLELHEQTLEAYSGFASSFTGGTDNWAWELTSEGGVEATDSLIRSASGDSSLTLNFTSQDVYAIGSQFMLLSQEGSPMDGLIQLMLSDGSSYISTVSGTENFVGFISDDSYIESLSLFGFGEYAPDITAISSFTIGVIPAPATMGLLTMAGMMRRRRH